MTYLVLFKFNNAQNARFFESNPLNQPFQPETVQVPQGYTPTTGTTGQSPGLSTGIGQPSGPVPGDTTTFVTLELPSIQMLTTFVDKGYNPLFVFDNETHSYQFDPNQIDPNTITIQTRPGDVIVNPDNLLAPMDFPEQLPMTPTNYPYPVDPNLFPPVFDQPDLRKGLQRAQSDQQIERQDLPPIPIPEPYVNPYDITDPRNFETLFPEIKPDPNAPIFVNPETDPNLDPNLLILPPQDTMPMEMQDLPQRHLDPKNPTLEPVETPTLISDSGEGGGGRTFRSMFSVYESLGIDSVTSNQLIIHTSLDGFTWNAGTLPYVSALTGSYGNGFYAVIAVTPGNTSHVVITSTDLIHWIQQVDIGLGIFQSVSFDSGNNQMDVLDRFSNVIATIPCPLSVNTVATGYFANDNTPDAPVGIAPPLPGQVTNFKTFTNHFDVSTNHGNTYTQVVVSTNPGASAMFSIAAVTYS